MWLGTILATLFLATASAYPTMVMDTPPYGTPGEFIVEDGVVYVSISGGEDPSWCSGVAALDIDSGVELWFRDTIGEDAAWPGQAPWHMRFEGGRLYMVVNRLGLLCLDASDGEELFRWEPEDDIITPFILDDGVLYAASKTEISALDAETGEVLWRWEDTPGEIGMWPTIIDLHLHRDRLFAGAIVPEVHCFEAATGEYLWNSDGTMDSGGAGYAYIHQVSDSLVFVSTASGELSLLDLGTGEAVGHMPSTGYLAGDEGDLFVFDWTDDRIRRLDPITGDVTGVILPEAAIGLYTSHAVLTDGMLCLGTGIGWLVLVPRMDDLLSEMIRAWRVSTGPVWMTAVDDRVVVVSPDGTVLSVDLPACDVSHMETGLEIVGAVTIVDGTGYFATFSGLAAIDFNDPDWQEGTP